MPSYNPYHEDRNKSTSPWTEAYHVQADDWTSSPVTRRYAMSRESQEEQEPTHDALVELYNTGYDERV